MVATVVHWLEGNVPAGGLVVDLGAGTGALGAAVLEALPNVRVELVDIDPNMLEVAVTRCAAHADRIRLRHARFQDELPRCHAVVASLALHHVAVHSEKRELYRAIYDARRRSLGARAAFGSFHDNGRARVGCKSHGWPSARPGTAIRV